MYQSRLHISNGLVSIALDVLNAEILEFVNERTGDNVIKNHVRQAYSPFTAQIIWDNESLPVFPPRYLDIVKDGTLKPQIQITQEERKAKADIYYPAVVNDGRRFDISMRVTIELPENQRRSIWNLWIENRQSDVEVDRVQFPCINGLWLGDSWSDDNVAVPMHAGVAIQNPTAVLAAAPTIVDWKWQEYIYRYQIDGPTGAKDDRGAYVLELPYSGSASMLWMDLYDTQENSGVYLTCRNEEQIMKALRLESFGESKPGISMSIVHYPCLGQGDWTCEECVIDLHDGDWHYAADDYRHWRASLVKTYSGVKRPAWFEKSPGLVAHYDFQYQGGGIVHRFKDIPKLYFQAKDMGINHLMLSGWNEDGFDYGFPQYRPNPNLGSEQDLADAVHQVRNQGGHVAFYLNSRLCNTAFPDRQDTVQKSSIMNRNGGLAIEKYGAADAEFACLCNQDVSWRDEFVDFISDMSFTYGADSVYLDQFAMAASMRCYHPGHLEHAGNPTGWNQGYEKMLEQIASRFGDEDLALIYEGCSDIYGPSAAGQLVSTMFYSFSGALPELYKYTFPEQILVDMMNPRRNSAMRAEHVARLSNKLLFRAFVLGSYFWIYDLEWDNTFRRDPDQYERLKRVVALRTAWLEEYGHGTFTDTVGLVKWPAEHMVKKFNIPRGVIIACASENVLSGRVTIEWDRQANPVAFMHTDAYPGKKEVVHTTEPAGDVRNVSVQLPSTEIAIIVLIERDAP